ncbi:MAG: glycosyltransferase family 4 protein [Bacteroidales bacterium]|nr:glycosyltransferase family 4 protein [Bacteroidales bacterium]
MKVLFVSSGKSGNVGNVVRNQGESLKAAGIEIDYYIIKPGLSGYLSAIPDISKTFKRGNYDLAHAHYSLSGFAASLAGCSPLVVSLMGSDAFMSGFLRTITQFFYKYKWDTTIVKTRQMKELLRMKRAQIIPNGVDIERFKPITMTEARTHINYQSDKKIILFISDPNRTEKNYDLAKEATAIVHNNNIELKQIYNVPNAEVPYYLNAADVLLLTSKYEGSVNVVKEAMACNCPVVSTDVGDVKWMTGGIEGCYITSFEPEAVADKIKAALAFGKITNGRERIIELGLDSETIARRVVALYEEVSGNQ